MIRLTDHETMVKVISVWSRDNANHDMVDKAAHGSMDKAAHGSVDKTVHDIVGKSEITLGLVG